MDMVRADFSGSEKNRFGIGAETSRLVSSPALEEGERTGAEKGVKTAGDEIHISSIGRSLSSGELEPEKLKNMLEFVQQEIRINSTQALSAHSGLNAYRVASLLSGLE